jgi:hypothetical protein
LAAQALSKRASGSKARFVIIRGPFADGVLLGSDAREIGLVGGARRLGGGAVIGDRARKGRLLLAIELLEAGAKPRCRRFPGR